MNDQAQELEEEDEDEGEPSELTLIFTAEGNVVLEEDGEGVFFSDDDDDFQTEFGEEFLDAEHDATDVLNWLVDEGYLDEEEKSEVNVEQELEGDGDT